MSITVSASEVDKDFEHYHDRALSEPVRVTKDGRETVYIVSAKAYREMTRVQREVLDAGDLSDHELVLIEAAEIPAEYRHPEDE